MKIHIETDTESFLIAPLLCARMVRCENPDCGETHGFAILIGWIFWTLVIHFPTGPNENTI